MAARGKFKEKNWRRSNGDPATIDDITVIVIPILPYENGICNPVLIDENGDNGPESPEEEVELEVHFDNADKAHGKVEEALDNNSEVSEEAMEDVTKVTTEISN